MTVNSEKSFVFTKKRSFFYCTVLNNDNYKISMIWKKRKIKTNAMRILPCISKKVMIFLFQINKKETFLRSLLKFHIWNVKTKTLLGHSCTCRSQLFYSRNIIFKLGEVLKNIVHLISRILNNFNCIYENVAGIITLLEKCVVVIDFEN